MNRYSIKKVISGLSISILLVSNISSTVFAATNSTIFSAADSAALYLSQAQQADGSISGYGSETDWTSMAIASHGVAPDTFVSREGVSLTSYLSSNSLDSTASATNLERRILAIAATGAETSMFSGVNYHALLKATHNGGQIGDPILLNDDIFGILAIAAANDAALKPVAQDALNYLIAHQQTNGGFSYTTATCDFYCGADSNDTAAAIVALHTATELGIDNPGLEAAKTSALAFLLSTKQSDGGFGYDTISPSDGSSTAWGLIALNSIGNTATSEGTSARDWLLNNQNADGGFSYGAYGMTTSDTYTTTHAVIALLGTNWILNPAAITRHIVAQPETIAAPVITQEPLVIAPEVVITPVVNETMGEPIQASVLASQDAVIPQINEASTIQQSAETVGKSTSWATSNVFGYGLISSAVIGTAGYAVRRYKHAN